jgi:radical SAM superfamily enzyme YgiQ (UPF0313 family)
MKSKIGEKMIDILLVNPPSPDDSIIIRDLNRSGRTSKERIIWPQTNLAYMAAMVDETLEVEIIDCIAEDMDWKQFEQHLLEKKPRYLVSHVITSLETNDIKTFYLAKQIGECITIAMGPHVTELTEEVLTNHLSLDFIIRGETEITFKELITTLEQNGDLSEVNGIAYRDNGVIKTSDEREFITNLDELPLPRHDLLPLEKYVFPFIASKFTFVISSRGCPYPCTFCRQPIMWDYKVRTRSAKNILEELKMLKKLGVNNFLFHSDTFTINKDIVLELCKMMIDEKLDMKWGCNSRVDTVDQEMLNLMKKAGCWMIAYGIESGSQQILDNTRKEITLDQSVNAVKLTHDIGISVYGYFIIGLPGETKETINETIEFAKELPLTFAIFHVGSPYPGTVFYKEAKEKGWLNFTKWEDVDQGKATPVVYPDLSSDEILKGIKKAYLAFYLRPVVALKVLRQIKNFKDIKHLINITFEHIK